MTDMMACHIQDYFIKHTVVFTVVTLSLLDHSGEASGHVIWLVYGEARMVRK